MKKTIYFSEADKKRILKDSNECDKHFLVPESKDNKNNKNHK